MINIGKYNLLEVKKETDFGFYLGDEGKEEILIPKSMLDNTNLEIGEKIEVFVYKDSKDRPIATLKKPLATVGEVAYLEVVFQTEFGSFVDFGLDRDLFVPLKEQRFKLHKGNKYLFYIYVDKTERLAATTEVDNYIVTAEEADKKYEVGEEVIAQVYSKTSLFNVVLYSSMSPSIDLAEGTIQMSISIMYYLRCV